jgi:hypothetical protein
MYYSISMNKPKVKFVYVQDKKIVKKLAKELKPALTSLANK